MHRIEPVLLVMGAMATECRISWCARFGQAEHGRAHRPLAAAPSSGLVPRDGDRLGPLPGVLLKLLLAVLVGHDGGLGRDLAGR